MIKYLIHFGVSILIILGWFQSVQAQIPIVPPMPMALGASTGSAVAGQAAKGAMYYRNKGFAPRIATRLAISDLYSSMAHSLQVAGYSVQSIQKSLSFFSTAAFLNGIHEAQKKLAAAQHFTTVVTDRWVTRSEAGLIPDRLYEKLGESQGDTKAVDTDKKQENDTGEEIEGGEIAEEKPVITPDLFIIELLKNKNIIRKEIPFTIPKNENNSPK